MRSELTVSWGRSGSVFPWRLWGWSLGQRLSPNREIPVGPAPPPPGPDEYHSGGPLTALVGNSFQDQRVQAKVWAPLCVRDAPSDHATVGKLSLCSRLDDEGAASPSPALHAQPSLNWKTSRKQTPRPQLALRRRLPLRLQVRLPPHLCPGLQQPWPGPDLHLPPLDSPWKRGQSWPEVPCSVMSVGTAVLAMAKTERRERGSQSRPGAGHPPLPRLTQRCPRGQTRGGSTSGDVGPTSAAPRPHPQLVKSGWGAPLQVWQARGPPAAPTRY